MDYVLIILIVSVWLILVYNKALNWKIKVENSMRQIDIQLKAKVEKIPNLVETAKKYAKFELEIFEKTSVARAQFLKAITVEDAVKINEKLDKNIDMVFALSENYSDLKSDELFKELQKQIKEIQDKIEMYRQFYNDTIILNNRYIHSFPNNIVLKLFGFKEKKSLEIDVRTS